MGAEDVATESVLAVPGERVVEICGRSEALFDHLTGDRDLELHALQVGRDLRADERELLRRLRHDAPASIVEREGCTGNGNGFTQALILDFNDGSALGTAVVLGPL